MQGGRWSLKVPSGYYLVSVGQFLQDLTRARSARKWGSDVSGGKNQTVRRKGKGRGKIWNSCWHTGNPGTKKKKKKNHRPRPSRRLILGDTCPQQWCVKRGQNCHWRAILLSPRWNNHVLNWSWLFTFAWNRFQVNVGFIEIYGLKFF